MIRVLQIVPGTSVDGLGLRTSVYLAGCSHHCPECHNPVSWDFLGGEEYTPEALAEVVAAHGFPVTLTGGDPLQHSDLQAVEQFVDLLSQRGLAVWCYTGYTIEQLHTLPHLASLLPKFEAIVDGPYIAAKRANLPFRGSSNQRIVRPDGSPFPLNWEFL